MVMVLASNQNPRFSSLCLCDLYRRHFVNYCKDDKEIK
jgi:hypothetical protein